ncbi:TonB family protein [Granulicella sp. S156]|uniref:TonB family protein n=1 Tax=Granulicella sp. S156 TaxID=1747224 RepID=UPI00131CFE83|nr:TonB family protein [Granulicella sp. S156]
MKTCPQCRSTYPDDYQSCPRDQQLLTAAMPEIGPGSILRGKYEVLSKLGAGGMATVFKVRHLAFHQTAALKLVHPEFLSDPAFLKRFRNEAVVAWQLKHPNAVRIDDLDFTEDGRPFIVMEYIEGMSLYDMRKQKSGPWPAERCLTIVAQVVSALGAAHTVGIVHRDIKPSNIMLTNGPDGRALVKVLDFGIAKTSDRAFAGMTSVMTAAAMIVGTPEYMSPEQASGGPESAIDGRADLYAVGVILYELVTGAHPFRADTPMGMLVQQLHTAPSPPRTINSDVSPALSALIVKALQKKPEDRFQSAAEMLKAVEDPEKWWREQQPAVQDPQPTNPETPTANVVAPEQPLPVQVMNPPSTVAPATFVMSVPETKDIPPPNVRLSPRPVRQAGKQLNQNHVWLAVFVVVFLVVLGVGGYLLFGRKRVEPVPQAVNPPVPAPVTTPAPATPPPPPEAAAPSPTEPAANPDLGSPAKDAETSPAPTALPPSAAAPVVDAAKIQVTKLLRSGQSDLRKQDFREAAQSFASALLLDKNNAEARRGLAAAQKGVAGLSVAGASPKPPPVAGPASGAGGAAGPCAGGGNIVGGQMLEKPAPTYPAAAISAHVTGVVTVRAFIAKDGSVKSATAVSGPELLKGAAVDAVRAWKYRPFLQCGQPVEAETTVSLNFNLGAQ